MDDNRRDIEAINRVLAGEVEQFRLLVEAHQQRIFAVAVRLVANETEAMDLTQQTFLEAYQALGRFDTRRNFRGWLSSIAINNCKDFLKSHKRKESQLDRDGEVSGAMFASHLPSPERSAAGRQRLRRLASALATLEPKYRVPVVLKDVEGYSYKEMGRILELPVTTLKMRVVRGRRQLIEAMAWTQKS